MAVQLDKTPADNQSGHARSTVAEKPGDPARAWAAYRPDARRPWNLALAGHLYRRAAFGADWSGLRRALSDGPQLTIDRLLRPQANTQAFNREHDEYESSSASADALRPWWLRRIMLTPHPLLEKMTLFWHSHFATNGATVKNARLMQRHVRLLRSHALGSFGTLLKAVTRDPAVLIYLGAAANRKARPNESFARALMETFTLGPGHCTEKDIRETARCFTGWFVLRGRLRYIPREHDDNIKTILGQTGNFTGDDVLQIVLEQPATAKMLVRKLYRWLICEIPEPNVELIAPLVDSFAKDHDVLKLVETMLRSNLFFSAVAYRRRTRCPVEFALGIVKPLEGVVSTTQLAVDLAAIGQNLYNPPTVKGWTGGRHWINSATIVGRHNLALELLRGKGPYAGRLNPWAVAGRHEYSTPESAARFLLDLFLQGDLQPNVRESLLETLKTTDNAGGADPADTIRRFAHAVVTLPEFHLA